MFFAKNIQLIIFDFDGVLGESSLKFDVFRQLFDLLSSESSSKDSNFEFQSLERLKNYELSSTDWKSELAEIGIDTSDKTVASYISDRVFEASRHSYAAFSWAERILPMLSKRYKLAICSNNCRKTIDYCLSEHINLFSQVKTYENVEKLKPHPDGLLAICDKENIHPSNVLFIGDSQEDITAANKAGMQIAIATWGGNRQNPYKAGQKPFGEDILHLSNPESLLEIVI